MSDKEESESSSSSDDDGPPEISEEFEKSFFKTLSKLKNNDPTIYDGNTKFFDALDVSSVKNKGNKKDNLPKKNFNVEQLSLMQEDDKDDVQLPYNVEQKQLKESLSKFVNDSDDEGDLLVTSKKSQEQIEKEEADYIQWLKGQKQEIQDKNTEQSLKNLREYWNSNLDDDEAYLRDYILNKKFLDKEESDVEDLSEDSEDFEQQEEFEKEYNFRYESNDLIRRFPRNVDTSLRRKNSKRSEKRKEIKERKKMEKSKKQEVINRQKNLKAKEIAERLEKLKELTGNEKLAFNDNDIIEDFNSEEFDKKMNQMFDDNYYEGQDDEKPGIDDLDFGNDYGELDEPGENEDGEGYGEESNYAEEAEAGPSRKERKKTRTKRKKERKKKSFQDIANIEKPLYDPKLHESYQKYMDEYYSLDCEDFIEDIPCRYKYREVEPNDYGLTVEEILMADDKELNAWSSVKNILKLRPAHVERNHAKQYQWKAKNENIKRKILPSLFVAEEEDESISKKKKKKKNRDEHEENDDTAKQEIDDSSEQNNEEIEEPKKSKSKKKNKKIEETDSEIKTEDDAKGNMISQKDKQKKNKDVIVNEEFEENDEIQQNMDVKKNKKKKRKENSDEIKSNSDLGEIEESVDQKEKKRKRQDQDFNQTKKRENFDSKEQGRNKFNKYSKYNKKNHDFHDTRLSAYGLNPKKFKVK